MTKTFRVEIVLIEERGENIRRLLTSRRSPELDLAWADALFNALVGGVVDPTTVVRP
jgi:hypothetical protein